MAPTHVELYEALRPTVGDQAAAMMAEIIPPAADLARKSDIAELREDLVALRGETRVGFAAIRGEMREESAAIRGEMREESAAVRGEFAAVRGEMREGFQMLRAEMQAGDMRTIKWLVGIFVPMLVGIWGTVIAALLKG